MSFRPAAAALALTVAVLLLLVAGAAVTGRWAWARLNSPYLAYSGGEITVTVEAGQQGAEIISHLARLGVLRDPLLCRGYLRLARRGQSLKAGEYRFAGPNSAVEVLDTLIAARVLTHRVTVLEGLTLDETAETLAKDGFGKREVFLRAMESPALIADLDAGATDLEGYLFPDTYAFATGTSEAEIVQTLVDTARKRLLEHVIPYLGPETEFNLRETVTLASIVEKEALLDSERPVIAGVYRNRLRRGMGLYADPTVIYALKEAGTWDGNIRRRDLNVDSPYNTYRVAGLPPGPIASPGLASLQAAVQPADVPYLYFVSRNDGTHVFSKTLAEHNRNVYIWQKKYWRDRWQSGRE